jgi:predicted ATPase/DNA-binding SARP family transcriptional activator
MQTHAHTGSSVHADAISVHLLGGFRVAVGARVVGDREWRLRKAKSLMKLLALAPGHQLHREQLLDLLWPELTPAEAAHNLHQTLYVARRTLQPVARKPEHFLLLREESIALAPEGNLWIDVEAFESAGVLARRSKEVAAYRAALDLYPGDLLPEDRFEDWAGRRRDGLRQAHQNLLIELAALYEVQAQFDSGIDALQQALAIDPAHEEAQRALMRLYALGGRRRQALRQYQLLREVLEREVDAAPDSESERLYRQILAGDTVGLEPAHLTRAADSTLPILAATRKRETMAADGGLAPHNLPAPLASFVGRENELAELTRRLALTRLLTLVGSGGCGKTRLALHAAWAAHDSGAFHDGVWFVALDALSEPALMPHAVGMVLGIVEPANVSISDALLSQLKARHVLLVLDNCEHMIGACADLAATLLRACPEVHILATSREPLRILGELTWRVPSLSLPSPEDQSSPAALMRSDAVRLFVERATAVSPVFSLTPQNAPLVARICARLDGIPLALELAAARLSSLSAEQIANRLDDVFRLLTGGSRTALPRQQTLRALMDWGYALLPLAEQALFCELSVFIGGFTLEAAEAVCTAGAGTTSSIVDGLFELVNKSLVLCEPDGEGVRYRMLQTIRQYAEEMLAARGAVAPVRRRHAEYYLALAEDAELRLLGMHQAEWLARLEREYENLLAALIWSKQALEIRQAEVLKTSALPRRDAAGRQDAAEHADLLLRLTGALWSFWYARGSVTEGRQWLAEALAQRGAASDAARTALVKVLAGAGTLAWLQGDYVRAEHWARESLAQARTLEKPLFVSIVSLTALGSMALDRGDSAQAMHYFEEGLALMRAAGNRFGIAFALDTVGNAARQCADYARADRLLAESLALQREIGDQWGAAVSLHNLAQVALDQEQAARAYTINEEALTLFQGLGNAWGEAMTLYLRGEIARRQSDAPAARRDFEACLVLARKLEDRMTIARVSGRLADVAVDEGNLVYARDLYRESLTLRRALDDRPGTAGIFAGLAALAVRAGQRERAAQLFGAADTLRQSLGLLPAPAVRTDPTGAVANARAMLSGEALAGDWAAGKALTLESAIQYALNDDV